MALLDLLVRAKPVPPATTPTSTSSTLTSTPTSTRRSLDPYALAGLGLAVVLAVAATMLGKLVPAVGAVPFGIALGIAVAACAPAAYGLAARAPGLRRLERGFKFASTALLQLAVVLLGVRLSLGDVARVGLRTLPVMLGTLAVCLVAAFYVGKWLEVPSRIRTLIGVGTGICGATAIAAIAPIIGATAAEISYAVSTIFVFNIGALFVFPALGHAFGMSMDTFGIFAGTAVNDTSSVVATAASFGLAAMNIAVVVKLVRTLMIVPISMTLAAHQARVSSLISDDPAATQPTLTTQPTRNAQPVSNAGPTLITRQGGNGRWRKLWRALKLIPTFLLLFIVVVAINSTGIVPANVGGPIGQVSAFLITVALCAIGLGTDFAALRRAGLKPLGLGAILWALVTASSLIILTITG